MTGDTEARKVAFSVRIDAALEDGAFHAPTFRFRLSDGTKKQTSVIGTSGWTPHPETPGTWRYEVVVSDVVANEALVAAIDDDPIIAFVLSDTNPTTSAAASTPAKNDKARPTTGATTQEPSSTPRTSNRGRLIADVLELDASALFVSDCLHIQQTWTSTRPSESATYDAGDDNTSVFARRPTPTGHHDSRSLFAMTSGFRSITIRLAVDHPLLSPALRRKFNPLSVTIGTARRLPGLGTGTNRPHDTLGRWCRPVYASWRLFPDKRLYPSHSHSRVRLVVSPGRAHGETITWQHTTTVLCGRCDPAELTDALHASSLTVEIHDRDISHEIDKLAKLHMKWESLHTTGVDPTLSTSPEALASARSTSGSRHSTPRGGAKPLDAFAVDEIMKHDWHDLLNRAGESFAYGAAVFRLDELLHKAKALSASDMAATPAKVYMTFKLTADVLARKRRAQPINAAALAESEDVSTVARTSSDSSMDKRVREPGEYVASGTTLSIHVTLQHALSSPVAPPPSRKTEARFGRFVLLFPYKETSTLTQIMRVLEAVNLRVLPDGISLRSYQLTSQEKHACDTGELDVLTGCMVIDDDFRVVILEGLADGAMLEVYRALPRTKPQRDTFRMFANEQLRFTERLYTRFDVDLKRIKLRYALPMLLQMPDIYMRTKVAEPCYAALTCLLELRRVSRLAEVKELSLFPTATMLLEVESKYGESISLEDIHGRKKASSSVASSAAITKPHRVVDPRNQTPEQDDEDPTDELQRPQQHTSTYTRLKAPTDASNPAFEAYRKSRQSRDYLDERRKFHEEQQFAYQEKKRQEEEAMRNDPRGNAPVYLYSGQKLRSQDALQDELRQRLSSDHRSTYTYGPEFQSLTLSLVNPDELRQTEEREARKKWTTQRGFVYPAPRPTAEYYQHPYAPSEARCEDLRMPFVDNANHPKPVSRDNNRGHDPRPEFSTLPSKDLIFGGTNGDGSVNSDYFRSVHLCGEQARKEMDEALQKEQTEWERKLVVDRQQIKFLAHGNICSQPLSTGPSSSQLDKLKDILNGPVRSKPLRIVRNATLPSGKRVSLLPPPASITSLQEYAGPVAATFASTLRQTNEPIAFLATDVTTGKPKDFHFPSISTLLTPPVKQHTTHKDIRPVQAKEKLGFLWGNHNQ